MAIQNKKIIKFAICFNNTKQRIVYIVICNSFEMECIISSKWNLLLFLGVKVWFLVWIRYKFKSNRIQFGF